MQYCSEESISSEVPQEEHACTKVNLQHLWWGFQPNWASHEDDAHCRGGQTVPLQPLWKRFHFKAVFCCTREEHSSEPEIIPVPLWLWEQIQRSKQYARTREETPRQFIQVCFINFINITLIKYNIDYEKTSINIARGTTDPGYWVHSLRNLFQPKSFKLISVGTRWHYLHWL